MGNEDPMQEVCTEVGQQIKCEGPKRIGIITVNQLSTVDNSLQLQARNLLNCITWLC